MMAEGDNVRCPAVEYYDDKKDPDNYVCVIVEIDGLKKKTFKQEASNADIKFEATERSFCLEVTLNPGEKKATKFCYKVNQLPDPILTGEKETYYKVKKNDEITVMLKKVKPGSWARQLSSVGLETEET